MNTWGMSVRVPATLHFADGTEIGGALHVQSAVATHPGPETVAELLNRPEPFLPITLDEAAIRTLEQALNDINGEKDFCVDLESQTISGPLAGQTWPFSIAPFERMTLLEGLDEIGITMKQSDAIDRWEAETRAGRPYLQRLDI